MDFKKFFNLMFLPLFFYFFIFLIVFYKIFFLNYHFINHDNFIQFYVSFIKTTLYDSYLGYGFPVYGDPQWQIFYPFRYLFPKTLKGFDFYCLHFFLIGAYFTFLLSFEFTQKFIPSFIAGLIFSLSGSMTAQMSMLSVPATSSYLPVIFYFYYKLLYNNKNIKIYFICYIISIGLGFLSGQPQFLVNILLFLGIYHFFFIITYREDKEYIIKKTFLFLVGIILGLMIVSFSVFPVIEMTRFSMRSDSISFDKYNDYEFLFRNFINLFFPFFWGGIHPEQFFSYIYPENYVIGHNFHELFRYFGILPWLMILAIDLNKKEIKNFFIFSLIFYILWTLGTQTFVSKIMYHLPIVNRLRGPSRHFLEITFIFSILTAIGLTHIKDILNKRFKYFLLILVLIAFLPLIYFYLYPSLLEKYTKMNWMILPLHKNNGIIFQYLVLITLGILFFLLKKYSFKNYSIYFLLIFIIDIGLNIQYVDAILYATKKDLWEKADQEKQWLQLKLNINDQQFSRYYISRTCVSYNVYHCPLKPLLNNINSIYKFPSSSVYNPLADKYIAALNLLFSNRKDILANWNISYAIEFINSYDIFNSNILIMESSKKIYKLKIPQFLINEYKNFPLSIELFFSIYQFSLYQKEEKVSDNSSILKISVPMINYNKTLVYPNDINYFNDDCKSGQKYYKKTANRCLNLYSVSIPIKDNFKKDIEIYLEPLINHSKIGLHSVQITSKQKGNTIENSNFFDSYIDIKTNIYNGNAFYDEEDKKNIQQILYYDQNTKITSFKSFTPRAFFTKSIEYINPQELFYRIALYQTEEKEIDLLKKSYIHEKNINKTNFDTENTKIEWLEFDDYYFKLKTFNKEDGFLVLLDHYYPSWKAFVDNKETKIYPTNIIGRGIFIPKGEHIIEFKFYPTSLYYGIIVSIVGFVILILFLFFYQQTPRNP